MSLLRYCYSVSTIPIAYLPFSLRKSTAVIWQEVSRSSNPVHPVAKSFACYILMWHDAPSFTLTLLLCIVGFISFCVCSHAMQRRWACVWLTLIINRSAAYLLIYFAAYCRSARIIWEFTKCLSEDNKILTYKKNKNESRLQVTCWRHVVVDVTFTSLSGDTRPLHVRPLRPVLYRPNVLNRWRERWTSFEQNDVANWGWFLHHFNSTGCRSLIVCSTNSAFWCTRSSTVRHQSIPSGTRPTW